MSEYITNEQDREFYIFGEPVETELGNVRFLTYKEYLINISQLSMMSLNVLHIYHQYRKMFDNQKLSKEDKIEIDKSLEEFKKQSLYSIVMDDGSISDAYYKIFQLVIGDENTIEKIFDSEELFMWYRALVLEMNMLQEDEVSPDKKVQEFIEKSKRVRQKNSEKQTLYDITSSIVVGANIPYERLSEMTVLQIYATYFRIGQMKSYDTTTLFATVSEKASIEAWNKSIDLFERQSAGIKSEDFNKQFGGLFK